MSAYECCRCRWTFATKTGGLCPDCGQPLTLRAPGAEPYGRPLEDDDLRETADGDVVLVLPAPLTVAGRPA